MSAAWPSVALGDVVEHRKEFITIDDLTTYRRPRVRLHAQGIVLRDSVVGADIKTKRQQVARAGEFLVAEIDAKVGGFGIVPDDLDGAIVSSHYFLYEHKPNRLDNKYLGWFVKTPEFRQQVEAQGSTNYAAIRPDDVLEYQIPLPPLDEQRRIVTRIGDLAAKLVEARGLRSALLGECNSLHRLAIATCLANGRSDQDVPELPECGPKARRGVEIPAKLNDVVATWTVPKGWRLISIAELLLRGALVDVKDGNHGSNHPKSSEFSDHGTPFLMASDINGGRIHWDGAARLPIAQQGKLRVGFSKAGDVLLTHKASIGKVAISDRDAVLSPQVTYYRCNLSYIEPKWLKAFIGSRLFLDQLALVQKQSTRDFVAITKQYRQFVLMPPLPQQKAIAERVDTLDSTFGALLSLQGETANELDAMLPAILDKAFNGEL